MNIERMENLAKFIETLPETRFDMSEWAKTPYSSVVCPTNMNACGTACCIAGWVVVLNDLCLMANGRVLVPDPEAPEGIWSPKGFRPYDSPEISGLGRIQAADYARLYLDLSIREAETLFYPWNWPGAFGEVRKTPQLAAGMIRWMIQRNKERTV